MRNSQRKFQSFGLIALACSSMHFATDENATGGSTAVLEGAAIPAGEVKPEVVKTPQQTEAETRNKAIWAAAIRCQPLFGAGAAYKRDLLVRRIVSELFKTELPNADLGEGRKVNEVFKFTMDSLFGEENIDETITKLVQQVSQVCKDLNTLATQEILLKHGIVPMDMAKAALNWRANAKTVNATYLHAAD